MIRTATLALCAILGSTGGLHAENAFDLVFRSGTLDGLPQGTELLYEGDGTFDPQTEKDWGQVVVDLGPDDSASVVGRNLGASEEPLPLGEFKATVGNPRAMVFLERTVQSIAEATGGSPFYIRNRMRDALGGPGQVEPATATWDGQPVEATSVALIPFANDAHRADLGAFADLEIRVVVSEAVPGWYLSIQADAPATGTEAAYASSLSLAQVEP